MASIKKQKNDYKFTVCVGRDSNGKQILRYMNYKPTAKTSTAIEREVKRAAALFEEQVRNGQYISGDRIKFSEYVEIWNEEWSRTHLTQRTRSDYLMNIKTHAFPLIGNMPMNKIKPSTIQSLITKLNQDHAPATVHKIIVSIDSVFRYAFKMEVIAENPIRRCELPKMNHDDKLHFFTAEQSKEFLSAIQKPYIDTYKRRNGTVYTEERTMPLQFQCYFHLALYSGCRRGELLALTWNDIDYERRKIVITKATEKLRTGEQLLKAPKTKAGKRELKLPNICFTFLKRWYQAEKELCFKLGTDWKGAEMNDFDNNFVFIQMTTGEQMHTDSPYQTMHRFIERYNRERPDKEKLPFLRLHDLRHTSATLLLSENMDIEEVSRRLGHAKPSTTLDIYGHAMPRKDDEAADILSRLLG